VEHIAQVGDCIVLDNAHVLSWWNDLLSHLDLGIIVNAEELDRVLGDHLQDVKRGNGLQFLDEVSRIPWKCNCEQEHVNNNLQSQNCTD